MAANDRSEGEWPLKNVVLCCTAVQQDVRTNLADVAVQMGAVHKLDLTSDVTHLIVGSINTPKYRYVAKERPDIKVLHSDWLEAVREAWMEGEEVNVAELEREHRFPIFFGLQICLTGFIDLDRRNFLEDRIKQEGATYHGDLTKAVTHLVAAAPEGAKYNHAGKWGIPIVSLKWFEDSLLRGMALEESLYDPAKPTEEQGKGAFRRQVKQRTSLGKRGREEDTQGGGGDDLSRKKLRRTASSRLEGQSQDMWSDMSAMDMGTGAAEMDQWKDDDRGILADTPNAAQHEKLMVRSRAVDHDTTYHRKAQPQENGLLTGHYMLIAGFEPNKIDRLATVLRKEGATIVQTSAELEDASNQPLFKERCLIVPHTAPAASTDVPDIPAGTAKATEWWIERCLHFKQLLDPNEDILSQPFPADRIPGFSDLRISSTGFNGVDLRQVAQAIELMGGSYQETILPNTSVLISGSPHIRKEKAYYASRHNIPVVSAEWLWACARTRTVAAVESFQIASPAFNPADFAGEHSTSSPAPGNTLDLSTEKLGNGKDDQPSKRLSSSRKKHATPSLTLHASKGAAATATVPESKAKSKRRPFIYQDDDDHDTPVQEEEPRLAEPVRKVSNGGSQPLQEISPNLSPRKSQTELPRAQRQLLNAEKHAKQSSHAPELPTQSEITEQPLEEDMCMNETRSKPIARPQSELAADLAELVNIQSNSRPSSAAPSEPPSRRKSRPLGRAPSGISNRSNSVQSTSFAFPVPESDFPESVGHDGSVEAAAVPPSTQLGYEQPEAEAHRRLISKKLGLQQSDLNEDGAGMRRVAGLSAVKDSGLVGVNAGAGGVSSRVKGKKARG